MKIKAHPGLCNAHGLCRRWAPEVYQLDDEGYLDLHLMEVPPELEVAAEIGATVCPAMAITIIRDQETVEGGSAVELSGGVGD